MKNSVKLRKAAIKELAKRELMKRNQKYRDDFPSFVTHFFIAELNRPFVWNWHHQIIFEHLEDLWNDPVQELLVVNIHPNSGKTELITKLYSTWKMGNVGDFWAMVIGYSADLTKDFSVEAREYVQSQTYKDIFGIGLDDKQKSKEFWKTDSKGRFYAVGVGGTITGKRADLMVIDDPVNPKEITSMGQLKKVVEWFKRTVLSRRRVRIDENGVMVGRGKIVIVMQRLHEYDLCGAIFEDYASKFAEGKYKKLVIPALALAGDQHRKKGEAMFPQFFDEEFLKGERESLSHDGEVHHFSAQYQQRPLDLANASFKPEYFSYKGEEELAKTIFPFGVIAVDPASSTKETADFRAITVVVQDKEGFYYVLEALCGRWAPSEFQQIIFDIQATYGFKVVVETNHGGGFIIENLKQKMKETGQYFQLKGVVNSGNKIERILNTLQPLYSSGRIIHSEKIKRGELEDQLLFFPMCKHDDAPDSLELGVKNMGGADNNSSVNKQSVNNLRENLRRRGVRV